MNITAKRVRMVVSVINNNCGNKYHLDHCHLGWRFMTADQATNISPRLTTREMWWWLDGFLAGRFR